MRHDQLFVEKAAHKKNHTEKKDVTPPPVIPPFSQYGIFFQSVIRTL